MLSPSKHGVGFLNGLQGVFPRGDQCRWRDRSLWLCTRERRYDARSEFSGKRGEPWTSRPFK